MFYMYVFIYVKNSSKNFTAVMQISEKSGPKSSSVHLADLSESNEFCAISATNCGSDTTCDIRPRHSAAQQRTSVLDDDREPGTDVNILKIVSPKHLAKLLAVFCSNYR
jgi:hypothetical protein